MIETVFSKPGKFWRGNLHTHSTCSDGKWTPEAVCRLYKDAGYDFVAITDHFKARYGWPITDTLPFRSEGFTTLVGAELHTDGMDFGNGWHIVALGLPFDFAQTPLEETGPELARRALDAGAFVIAAHPHWYAMTENDFLSLGDIHAVEIFNAGVGHDSDTAESTYMLDLMLARGKRLSACATDDAHFNLNARDRIKGWVRVKSTDLSPEALLTALKAGDYYSSTGPSLYDVQVIPGEKLYVRCSPASQIYALGRPIEFTSVSEHSITEVEFSLKDWRSDYVRVLVRDEYQHKAWSNPIWFR
ncbi:MAG: CehA/McbA family metallohydrolase [Chloroflexi bacterium]|nr:CehA/McbA family metallohydrolase [Chloroflexota bacterium]MCC6895068.1 CehA/McbA family metallohydrolase [Anaerolineae bacterium]